MQVDGDVIIKSLDNILAAAEKDVTKLRVEQNRSFEYKLGYSAGFSASHRNWRDKVSKFRAMMTIFFGR